MHRSIRYALFILLFTVPAAAQTTDALWQSLMEGNRVFVAGKLTFDHLAELRHESAGHQNPPVTVLSCADSRVPPELAFNRSIDQLFVVRVAGTSPDRSTSPASSSGRRSSVVGTGGIRATRPTVPTTYDPTTDDPFVVERISR
ncbi:MAG TPA: carbonic anhydrase [Thermoanaerobaculia bacterium]